MFSGQVTALVGPATKFDIIRVCVDQWQVLIKNERERDAPLPPFCISRPQLYVDAADDQNM